MSLAVGAALAAGGAELASAQSRWTPADNDGIAALQGSLTGAHIGASISGVLAPGMLGLPFEIIAYGTDIGLKNTPPLLYLPPDLSVFPNHVGTGGSLPTACVYKFVEAIPDHARTGTGVEADFGGIFFVPYNPLDDVWADLGPPTVYHPHASIDVSVQNPYLTVAGYPQADAATRVLLARVPEFPEGRHVLDWQAGTSLNYVLDATVPPVLIGVFAYAEYKLASKVGAEATKQGAKNFDEIAKWTGIGLELGLIGVDVSDVLSAHQWYEDTSITTAINAAQQTLTVWDIHRPYFRDTQSGATQIFEQTIQLEATDFGGVRLGRVAEALRARFEAVDDCGRPIETRALAPASTLLKVGSIPNVVAWEAREIGGGPYPASTTLAANQRLENQNIVTTLLQRVTVVDTQAPILVAPPGFARYSATPVDLTAAPIPLGRPLVVDLADPAPSVTSDAPNVLDVNHRYVIDWRATDSAGNTTAPAQQIVTIKAPGTNTAPTAEGASAATLTSLPVEVLLAGVDTDLIDGRVDPLAFEIEDYPPNGQFEAPLLPYFIEDFRLSPVGEREDEQTLAHTSPLGSLAAAFAAANPSTHGTFLTNQICNAAPGSANQIAFGNTIPIDFVYEPTYVHVDDKGFHYIRDKFWVCGESDNNNPDFRPTLSPIPRLSKWNDEGELVAMRPLFRTDSPQYDDPWLAGFPTDDFSVDHDGRLWVELGGFFTAGGRIAQFYSFDRNLADQRFHGTFGSNEQELTSGQWLIGIAGDSRLGLFYELRRNADCGLFGLPCADPNYVQHSLVVRADTADITAQENEIGRIPVRGLDDTDATGLAFEYIDLKVDRGGNVYVLDGNSNRVHKFSPTARNDAGVWELGEHVGWLGSCTANLVDAAGVPFNGCDEALGVSRGYACTDATCARAATTSGAEPGQFDAPRSIEIDPRDILYVADTGNSRVQRFGPDGTFAGEAKSTGSGVNQGDDPGFILGNMGEPKQLAVNSTSFYVMEPDPQSGDNFVHVFKTLPFYDVTDASAKVRYVSRFDFQGVDAFTYVVNDGIDRSAPAAVNVNVSRAFRPPERLASQCFVDTSLAAEIPCSVPEDGQIVVRMSAYDLDGFLSTGGLDTLTFNVLEQPVNGALDPLSTTDNAAVYRYSPAANYNGQDSLSFAAFDGTAASLEQKTVSLTVVPTPDPVAIEFPADVRGARGFPLVLTASYGDLDADSASAPSAAQIQWGDGTSANAPGWAGSGRRDPNGREIGPQEELGVASGLLIGSHIYASAGSYAVSATMKNAAVENLPDTTAATNVQVIEATVVGAELAAPAQAVSPDAQFPLVLDVTNFTPQGWAGLTAGDTQLALTVPEGLTIVALDARCSGTAVVTCRVGDLPPGATASLALSARIDLAAARAASVYPLNIEITDAGPKVQSTNLAVLTVQVADVDGDGIIDVDDAFPEDALYAVDTDGDGLPDEWETAHGFDAALADDTALDVDGDGFTLAEEFASGSYPLLGERQVLQAAATLQVDDPAVDGFGFTLAGGDLNQDGYADVVIGAPAFQSGAAFITYGNANGAASSLVRIDASAGLVSFGRSLAVADLDANGYPELAIGSTNGISIHLNNGQVLDTPDLLLASPFALSDFGRSLAAGDLDGDGAADLAVTGTDHGTGNGFVSLYLSRRGFAAPVTFASSASSFGASAAIADIDGDGRLDLLVGTLGQVHGFLATQNDWQTASALALSFVLSGTGSTYGFSIASGADIGGDGIADLVVGQYAGAGQVLVYDSATAYWNVPTPGATSTVAPSQTLNGSDDGSQAGDGFGDQFGVSVALGHLDTDTFADLVVGGNRAGLRDAGQIEIYRGSASLFVTPPQVETGATDRDMLGYFVAIPGDVDGNGFADVAAGAPEIATAQNPAPQGGYVRIYEHAFAAIDSGEDPDGDGVRTPLDNCPLAANTDRADVDGDGAGNVCDTDADGDGLLNESDNCPLIASLDQTNSDTDGLGNLCDDDDDNDDVTDANDPFPTDARYTADGDGDGMPDEYESQHGLDPADAADGLADVDGDGRSNVDEFLAGTDVAADDVAPSVTAPTDIVVNSIGPYTAVALGAATAVDAKDGALTAHPSATGPFVPGRHVIEWRASDAAGNEAVDTQQVDVIPRVDLVGATQYTGEGAVISVAVTLNGAPVSYPVSVPYTLGGSAAENVDYFVSGTLEISSGSRASLDLAIASDTEAEGEETVVVTLGAPTNALAGNTVEHVVRIVETNLAPRVAIKLAQGGGGRWPIVAGDGAVGMTVAIEDPNVHDGHTIDWSETDNALVPSEGFGSESFTFDPAGVAPGVYLARVRVTDDGGSTVTAERLVRIVALAPVLDAGTDSDGDGVDDATEGLADANQNGVSDYLEPTSDGHWLTAVSGGRRVLQARPGLTLVLGGAALASGDDATVTLADVANHGDRGGAALNAGDAAFDYPGGLFDFELHGLPSAGDSAEIVLALSSALPADASYRKYVAPTGWRTFETDARNAIASAPGALGACPAPGSADYAPGLHAGHYCVQLTIEDGGPNDADGDANRVLRDPGGAAVPFTPPNVSISALAASNRTVAAGTADVAVVRFRMTSDSANVAMSSLTLTASGTGNDAAGLAAVELWLDANGDGAVDAGDVLLGNGAYGADNGSLRLQLTTPYALTIGATDFLVTYDF